MVDTAKEMPEWRKSLGSGKTKIDTVQFGKEKTTGQNERKITLGKN